MSKILLAVNGTLMRGLPLENNLKEVNAIFIKESKTEESYQLFSINDIHPAMIKVDPLNEECASIDVEVYEISMEGLKSVLEKEPKGLCIGKANLIDGSEVFAVLGEPYITKNQKNITKYHGWRNYINSLNH